MLMEVIRLVFGTTSAAVGQLSAKEKSDKIYSYVVPELKDALKKGRPLTADDVQKAIEILKDLPPFGARRRNFSRYYLGDKLSLLKLPESPNDLAYGYWW